MSKVRELNNRVQKDRLRNKSLRVQPDYLEQTTAKWGTLVSQRRQHRRVALVARWRVGHFAHAPVIHPTHIQSGRDRPGPAGMRHYAH